VETCSKCHSKVGEDVKFCPQCGTQLVIKSTSEAAWIAGMQEKIKSVRHEIRLLWIVFVSGFVFIIVNTAVDRLNPGASHDFFYYLIFIIGGGLLVGSGVALFYYYHKISRLTNQLAPDQN
jgi:hypothetical protein